MRNYWLFLLLVPLPLLSGCGRTPARGNAEPPAPEVLVSVPVQKEVIDYEDFPGRTEAVNTVDIRAHVTGYLDKSNFTEGADVKKDDLLFEIDPRYYQAQLARAEASLTQAQARVNRLNLDYDRARNLLNKGAGAISREEFDKINGDRSEAIAAVGVAQADLKLAQVNLSYTKIRAPFDGRISRRTVDPGNLVKADETILTNLVSLDPIQAYFDVDERAYQRLEKLLIEGKIKLGPGSKQPVYMGMADDDTFPRKGYIDFADNRVEADTGTWRLRGVFDNPTKGLSSGRFVRIRLPIGEKYRALLVAEGALGADQGQRFVYVVDPDGKAMYRRVQVGRLHHGLRVITDGLAMGEKIVVSGLQRVRPGTRVRAKEVAMPVQGSGIRDQGSGVRSQESGNSKKGSGDKNRGRGKSQQHP